MKCPRCKKKSRLSCQSYQCILEKEQRQTLGKKTAIANMKITKWRRGLAFVMGYGMGKALEKLEKKKGKH
tara:strand:+ start:197 stop:406 length:210 start_codon:yes stop_codon:yes gene_type:complete